MLIWFPLVPVQYVARLQKRQAMEKTRQSVTISDRLTRKSMLLRPKAW